MFSRKKSPLNKNAKQNSVDPGYPGYSNPNPFDSDDEPGSKKPPPNPARRTSSEPTLITPTLSTNPFDSDEGKRTSSSSYSLISSARSRYKNDFRDSGGVENQSVQELEDYAAYKAEETTKTVKSCLKIAENMREDATNTLVNLHQQGEQITRTHMAAADIDHDLSRGEKLLGSLGGLFSRTWKPTKTHSIRGPSTTRDDPAQKQGNHMEQREKLGLTPPAPKGRSNMRTPPPEPTNALQKVEAEMEKQDDGLSDLSNILEELKYMAVDMGSEIDRQNKALDPFMNDVDELNSRVKGANQRGRRLLGK
ncbi:soluble N-ethylmaleimide-sensitive factor adaptor protein 33 [Actinidia rufa]|uniref:Soluble N-ethylmaleimide-sensitive factor adaptor protein 33 n=1 Tax=Actinidia rufa TaxID=165716 RepID=A0A7J0H1S2_9ERIC|nr:soluble N-ethylmaleimide-sensitive factor adaptor protein 33 [Actinidia rufa]